MLGTSTLDAWSRCVPTRARAKARARTRWGKAGDAPTPLGPTTSRPGSAYPTSAHHIPDALPGPSWSRTRHLCYSRSPHGQ
eukprot:7015447-Pyramimonas_sp.AAC.1